jgi:hypothetical protein
MTPLEKEKQPHYCQQRQSICPKKIEIIFKKNNDHGMDINMKIII